MAHLTYDKPRYFEIQYLNSKNSIVPFLEGEIEINESTKVIEIGCAEGGVLKPFIELGAQCVGVELNESRVKLANEFQKEAVDRGQIQFIAKNIYDFDLSSDENKFDIVILKDVIEHIHDQDKFMAQVGQLLRPGGVMFFGFPAWMMPYGGHQQLAKSKLCRKLPYYHLWPRFMYRGLMKICGEPKEIIESLMEIRDTRISTARFERLCKKNQFEIRRRQKYFIAPIYEYKFGYKTKKLWSFVGAIPWFRDFFTFQSYYVLKPQ